MKHAQVHTIMECLKALYYSNLEEKAKVQAVVILLRAGKEFVEMAFNSDFQVYEIRGIGFPDISLTLQRTFATCIEVIQAAES